MTNRAKTKKPSIAIYYHSNFGRNDGPPLYWFSAMQRLGLDVVHSMPEGDTFHLNGKKDIHLWVDYGEDGLPVDHEWRIPQDGGKTVYVASDTHRDNGYRLQKAQEFDYVFFNQKRAVEQFLTTTPNAIHAAEGSRPVSWLPHAAEPLAYPHTEQLKKYDVCFIGHFQDEKNYNGITRIDFLDRMFREFPNFYFGTRTPGRPDLNMFEDAAKKFNQSRVVLNISVGDDINMRVFEALCSGSLLLTNEVPTLSELFKDGRHLLTYKTLDEAVEKTRRYLATDKSDIEQRFRDRARETLAQAGREEVLKHHTYEERVKTMLKTLGYDPLLIIPKPAS